MHALSLDLRERVIAALESGQNRPQVAERFAISLTTVGRLAKQWREQKHLLPKPIPGRPRAILETQRQILEHLVDTQKDATLARLAHCLEQQTGKKVSKSALQRNLVWLNYSYKKSHGLPPRKAPRNALPFEKP